MVASNCWVTKFVTIMLDSCGQPAIWAFDMLYKVITAYSYFIKYINKSVLIENAKKYLYH